MKLYHATFQAYLSSIEEKGLLPGQRQNWEDCASGFVYFAKDLDTAVSFCEISEDTPDEIIDSGICCFELDSESLEMSKLINDPNILEEEDDEPMGCYAYAGAVPYSAIRLCWREDIGFIRPQLEELIDSAASCGAEFRTNEKSSFKDLLCER